MQRKVGVMRVLLCNAVDAWMIIPHILKMFQVANAALSSLPPTPTMHNN